MASIISGSCVAIAGYVAIVEQLLHQPDERLVDLGLLLIRDGLRLLVGALDQPDTRAERVHAPHSRPHVRIRYDCSTTPMLR